MVIDTQCTKSYQVSSAEYSWKENTKEGIFIINLDYT